MQLKPKECSKIELSAKADPASELNLPLKREAIQRGRLFGQPLFSFRSESLYFSEASSTLNVVASELSVVERNCTLTVCPL